MSEQTYCLYQDFPFRVRFWNEPGFHRPRKNDRVRLRTYNDEHLAKVAATRIAQYLDKDHDKIQITTTDNIVRRMAYDYET